MNVEKFFFIIFITSIGVGMIAIIGMALDDFVITTDYEICLEQKITEYCEYNNGTLDVFNEIGLSFNCKKDSGDIFEDAVRSERRSISKQFKEECKK